ncbi:MAG: formylglycine-generating enzyme family protein [Planctomycetota bacterium]|nr:formylglycine-generating enzyme family protein [Planctomycetota bacterium]
MGAFHEAVAFCEALSGREPGMTYRLPTEAEWEYACRGGTRTRFSSGVGDDHLSRVAWYEGNSGRKTHPVKQKKPNPWGLFDMHGNVWEWCADWYGKEFYCESSPINPVGPETGSNRVIRGGSWSYNSLSLRSADRNYGYPTGRTDFIGVRVLAVRR